MNKRELILELQSRTKLSQKDINAILDALFGNTKQQGIIAEQLKMGQSLTLPGFGTFASRIRGERKGKNPNTGKTIHIPSKRMPFIRFSKKLKSYLNES